MIDKMIVPMGSPMISSKDNDSTWSLVMLTTETSPPSPASRTPPRLDTEGLKVPLCFAKIVQSLSFSPQESLLDLLSQAAEG